MNRKPHLFKKMSLTQQILVIILLFLGFFIIFFFFYLSDSVDEMISSQMFTMIVNRQEPLVAILESETETSLDLYQYAAKDPIQSNLLITPDSVQLLNLADKSDKGETEMINFLKKEAKYMLKGQHNFSQGTTMFSDVSYFYCLRKCDNGDGKIVLASFMNDTYPQTLRTSLIDTAVYGTILAFFIFIVIMIIWVFSVIHPLNQIRNYIEQIKQGKEVELYINREDEIGEVANALVSMKEELDRQQKSKEEMMHNISHDLKTPIATIKSYSESIKDGIYPYGTLESSVDVIMDNAQRLEDKVHNLLYLNRVEYLIASDASGVVTNMKEVVESVVLNAAVIRPEIKIITDVEEVFFDGLIEAWRVTIENLMENAFRYAKSYIKIEVHENDLRISNDGPKMDESRIESLFRPYEKGEGGRFGLGLSIVQKVTKANNYNVEGFNTEDGVCFRIYRDVPKPNRLNIDLRRRNTHEDKQD